MSEPLVYVDRSGFDPASLPALRHAIDRLVTFVQSHEPQLLAYSFHVDEPRSEMTVVAVHPDSASLELHLRVGAPEFRRLAHLIELRSIDVYGSPDEPARRLLDEKARALGHARVVVHRRAAGFARMPS